MPLNLFQAITLRTASDAFVRIPVEKLDGNELPRMQCREKKTTYALNEVKSRLATFLVCVLGETQGIFGNALRKRRIRAAPERPSPKYKLVGTDTKGPPVNGVSISALVQNFGCHIGHGSGYTGKHSALGIVDSDVKVSEVSMATLI